MPWWGWLLISVFGLIAVVSAGLLLRFLSGFQRGLDQFFGW